MEKFLTLRCVSFPILLVLLMPHLSLSIDMESANDIPCFEVKNTTDIDLSWLKSGKLWYYPIMSRYELYHSALEILRKDPKEIPENELYYKFCASGGIIDSDSYYFTGFGGKRVDFKTTPDANKINFQFKDDDEKLGACYITLTDNKTFYFMACCYFKENQMSWGIDSLKKTLPEETLKQVRDHAEALGFKREHFTGLSYDAC